METAGAAVEYHPRMEGPPRTNRLMLLGSFVFLVLGVIMTIQGIQHTLSGEPIPATTWTGEATGPEQLLIGLIGIGLAVVAFRLARRGIKLTSTDES